MDFALPSVPVEKVASFTSGLHSTQFKLKWELNNFEFLKRSATTAQIKGQQVNFTVNAGPGENIVTEWSLGLNATFTMDCKEWIGFFYSLKNDTEVPVLSTLKLFVDDESGNERFWSAELKATDTPVRDNGRKNTDSWGSTMFVERSAVCPLVNGSLTVHGELTVLTPLQAVGQETYDVAKAEKKAQSSLLEELDTIWSKGFEFGSVRLVAMDGNEYYSNKTILAARSPVFEAMFTADMMEKEARIVKLEDCVGKAINAMLQYVHAGKLPATGFNTTKDILDLAYVAEKYELLELRAFCDHSFAHNWDKTRAQEMLEVAKQFNLTVAQTRIAEFIDNNLRLKPGKKRVLSSVPNVPAKQKRMTFVPPPPPPQPPQPPLIRPMVHHVDGMRGMPFSPLMGMGMRVSIPHPQRNPEIWEESDPEDDPALRGWGF